MHKAKFPGLMIFAILLLVRAQSAQAVDAACDTKSAPLRPLMQTHTLPPYPEMSVMTQEEGKTLVEVGIGTDGVPTDVQIVSSSGSVRLDEAARGHVKAVWRWSPPIKDCVPVATRTRVSIAWDLRDAPGGPSGIAAIPREMIVNMVSIFPVDDADYPPDLKSLTSVEMTMLMVVACESGAVDAVLVRPSSVPELDDKAMMLAKTRYHWTPALMNGRPVGASHLLVLLWTPPGVKKLDPKTFKDLMAAYLKADSGAQAAGAGTAAGRN